MDIYRLLVESECNYGIQQVKLLHTDDYILHRFSFCSDESERVEALYPSGGSARGFILTWQDRVGAANYLTVCAFFHQTSSIFS